VSQSNLCLFACVCVASLWTIAAPCAESSAAPDAEHSAKIYMTAFFSGDLKMAADLTDPRTLERIRESLLAQMVEVTDPAEEKAILASLGVAQSTVELSQLDARTLYVALTERDRRRNPQVFDAMKATRVEVLGSVANPAGGVTVQLRVTSPSGAGTSSQESKLLMRQVLGDWKVVGVAR
jgi:hypothetical protein